MSQLSPLAVEKGEELLAWCETQGFPMVSRTQVLAQRFENPRLLRHTGVVTQEMKGKDLEVHSFYSSLDQCYHWAFTTAGFREAECRAVVKLEYECLVGHVFGSSICDCSGQLEKAVEAIGEAERGVVVYLRQGEGHGYSSVCCRKGAGGIDERDRLNASLILKSFHLKDLDLLADSAEDAAFLKGHGLNL